MKKIFHHDNLLTAQIFNIFTIAVSAIRLTLEVTSSNHTAFLAHIVTMFIEWSCLVLTSMYNQPDSKKFFKTHIVLSLLTIAISAAFIRFGNCTYLTVSNLKSLSSIQTGAVLISIAAIYYEIQRTKEG